MSHDLGFFFLVNNHMTCLNNLMNYMILYMLHDFHVMHWRKTILFHYKIYIYIYIIYKKNFLIKWGIKM